MQPTSPKQSMVLTKLALTFGAGLPIAVILTAAQFLFVVPGTDIRPMAWTSMVLALSVGGLLFVVPLSLLACIYERRVWLPMLAAALSVTPVFLGMGMLHLISQFIGFEIAQ